jgi:hypothetical protein
VGTGQFLPQDLAQAASECVSGLLDPKGEDASREAIREAEYSQGAGVFKKERWNPDRAERKHGMMPSSKVLPRKRKLESTE